MVQNSGNNGESPTIESNRKSLNGSKRRKTAFTPSCTVVVCTRNRPEKLVHCLAAIMRLQYPNFEVVVVDNAPADGRTHELATRYGVRYVVEPVPGLSRARNRGARECITEIVAYMDDDEQPDSEWLTNIASEFADPMVMAVTGRIRPPAGRNVIQSALGDLDRGTLRLVVDRDTERWFELTNFGGIGDGGNMALRRSAFDIWPGFDERLGCGAMLRAGEEHHAFFSMVDRGFRVVYTPRAIVHHPLPASIDEVRTRHLSNFSSAAAYMMLLIAEEPYHRFSTIKYAAVGLLSRRRTWRHSGGAGRRRSLVPRWRELCAALNGLGLYVRSRLSTESRGSRRDWSYVPDFKTARSMGETNPRADSLEAPYQVKVPTISE